MKSLAIIQERPSRLRQRGAALLLLAVVVLLIASGIAIGILTRSQQAQASVQKKAIKRLQVAKNAVLNYAVLPDTDNQSRRIGQLLLYPDMPVNGHATYTGARVPTGCIKSDWTAGAQTIQPNPGIPNSGDARCFGRFPLISLGIEFSAEGFIPQGGGLQQLLDLNGEIPWLVFSNNLTGNNLPANLNTLMQGGSYQYPGFNNDLNDVPRPWLTVRDARGNVLSDKVAIVLIYPGKAHESQRGRKSANAHPNQWLDQVIIKPTCQQPCVPGTYSNYGFNVGNAQSMTFIQAPIDPVVTANDVNYALPYEFNDVVLYVTADEYFQFIKKRIDAIKNIGASLPSWATQSGWQNVP